MKSKTLGLLAMGLLAVGLLGGPKAAMAATFSLADPDPTVVRPATGTVTIDFYGTLTPDNPSDFGGGFTLDFLFDGAGMALDGYPVIPSTLSDPGNTLRFSWVINSTAALGLYQFNSVAVTDLSRLSLTLTSGTTGASYTVSDTFSIRLVDPASVPEPGTFILLALSLAGLGLSRRRMAA